MNEADYLKSYDKTEFESPILTVDSVLFTCHEETLKVLLVKRANHPDQGTWGLPGGFVDLKKDTSIQDTAIRKLQEKTGIAPPYIEQLISQGGPKRDKRGWSVTVCFSALIAYEDCSVHIDSVSNVQWITLETALTMELAFDHKSLITAALERLRQKALYSIVPAFALPEKFTLPDLQKVHEIVLGKEIQKKSFRRRIEQANLLIDTGEKQASGKRQAALYKMKDESGEYKFLRNLES
ncbi:MULTISPECIES: NUDIX domain-containing protein [unclassified Oleiphilus]|uniref:NUDIX hydrolase n=1 Tax=unclassified Oleiphilus TaxID=2631174 RepID=UPI0007C23144|nr:MULTISPECIES: NUDIX domain-containing protein [unclassified Oleiphilus]KZY45123.1 NUDIX hydrolase [Oleiphilus sp. HI0050]KZZ34832.1 NUDIX hydrolase [Oleiphilus sp. HI0117]KZZ56288.1 NUDIX hydrolase [Oleiphilus sp. HI0123]